MNLTEQLRLWGTTHAAARAAERAMAQPRGAEGPELERQARSLRERANALHREIYSSLGRKREPRAS